MGQYESLKLWDLMSYSKPVEVPLLYDSPALITARMASGGTDSNGAGKSTLGSVGFGWTLFGKISGGGEADSVIRDSEPSGGTELAYRDDKEDLWTLQQTRKRGKPPKVVIKVNGEAPADTWAKDTSGKARDYFRTRVLGMAPDFLFEDFMNTCFFSPDWEAYGITARDMDPAERVSIISRLLRLPVWDRAIKEAAKEADVVIREVEALRLRVQTIQEFCGDGTMDDLTSQLAEVSAKIAAIEKLQKQIDAVIRTRESVREGRLEIAEQEGQLAGVRAYEQAVQDFGQIHHIDLEAAQKCVDASRAVIDGMRQEKKTLDTKRLALLKKLNQVEQEMKAASQQLICPSCDSSLIFVGSELILGKEPDKDLLRKLKGQVTRAKTSVGKIEAEIAQLAKSEQVEFGARSALSAALETIEPLKKRAELARAKVAISDLEDTRRAVNEMDGELESLEKELRAEPLVVPWLPLDLRDLMSKVSGELVSARSRHISLGAAQESRREFEAIKAQLVKLESDMESATRLVSRLKEAKRNALEAYLPLLALEMSQVLDRLGGDYQVRLSTLSQSRDGTFRPRFSIDPYRKANGAYRPFKRLSQGELRRLGIAAFLAIRRHSEAAGRLRPDFPYVWDEDAADNLDATGREDFHRLVESIPGQHYVISHDESLRAMFRHHIVIHNDGGAVTSVECN